MHDTLQGRLTKQTLSHQELEEKIAKLQLGLLEKEAQVRQLQEKLDEAIQEVVRTKAKLHRESKAEAVSTIAEAEVALKALRAKAVSKEKGPEIIQAEDLLKMSARELEKHNYSGALYLASRAKGLVNMGQRWLMSREKIALGAGEVLFAVLLPLQVLGTSNVREGPGLDFKVLFTLEKGTPLVGHSYNGQWVRVKHEDGRGGWIFHTLVDGRQDSSQ